MLSYADRMAKCERIDFHDLSIKLLRASNQNDIWTFPARLRGLQACGEALSFITNSKADMLSAVYNVQISVACFGGTFNL